MFTLILIACTTVWMSILYIDIQIYEEMDKRMKKIEKTNQKNLLEKFKLNLCMKKIEKTTNKKDFKKLKKKIKTKFNKQSLHLMKLEDEIKIKKETKFKKLFSKIRKSLQINKK